MNPQQAVAEHIEYLHKKVKALQQQKITMEEIVDILKKEDAIDELYARPLIDNIETDKEDKKRFWRSIIASIVAISAGIFVLFAPQFDGFRQGLIYWFLVWTPICSGAIFLTRAFVLFRK